ncbi:MAG TPA: carbohydrate ABC transporter permease [Candidatus Manganitrophaceae bacterium]|nr:carbohydrate ABC transporter permease [Candidatus Manganitrophaceae bacterium]
MKGKIVREGGFALLLSLVLVYTVAPIVWQAITSVKPEASLTTLPPLLPERFDFSRYPQLFRQQSFPRSLFNSFMIAGLSTFLALLLAAPAAFSLAKLPIRWKAGLMTIVLAVSLFPPISIVSPLYLIIRSVGLRDTWWGLILTDATFALPLALWILTSFFEEIPDELYRAARVDGCTPVQAFRKIFLPIAAPGFFTAAILVFISCWNEFLFALTFTTTEASRTVPVEIALFPGLHETPYGEIAAASLVVALPVVLLTLLFQRKIVSGLTAGAIKG